MTQDSREERRRKHMAVMDDAQGMPDAKIEPIEPVEDPDFLWHGIITDDASLSYQCFGELELEPDEFNTRWAYPPTKYVRHDLFQTAIADAKQQMLNECLKLAMDYDYQYNEQTFEIELIDALRALKGEQQ